LAANQSGKANLVSVTVYLRHIDDLPRVNKVWAEWLGGHLPPARATVQAALAHSHLLVEMSAVAMAEVLSQDAAQ
jgi:enamine deaminase RidA (YjgF/YER057c/UK114 family)